jgi:hypothetical protein
MVLLACLLLTLLNALLLALLAPLLSAVQSQARCTTAAAQHADRSPDRKFARSAPLQQLHSLLPVRRSRSAALTAQLACNSSPTPADRQTPAATPNRPAAHLHAAAAERRPDASQSSPRT